MRIRAVLLVVLFAGCGETSDPPADVVRA